MIFGDPASHLSSYLWGFLFGSLFWILKRISFSPPSPTIKLKISACSEGSARIKAEGKNHHLTLGGMLWESNMLQSEKNEQTTTSSLFICLDGPGIYFFQGQTKKSAPFDNGWRRGLVNVRCCVSRCGSRI